MSGENDQSIWSATPATSANGRRPAVYMRVADQIRSARPMAANFWYSSRWIRLKSAVRSAQVPGSRTSVPPPGRWPMTAASVTALSSWSGSVNVVPQSLISKLVNAAGSKVSTMVRPANGGSSRAAQG